MSKGSILGSVFADDNTLHGSTKDLTKLKETLQNKWAIQTEWVINNGNPDQIPIDDY